MYLHAGNNFNVRLKDIIGIFDMDTATVSSDTQKFLKKADCSGKTESLFDEVPKSFILTDKEKIYFSQISTSSLSGRIVKAMPHNYDGTDAPPDFSSDETN